MSLINIDDEQVELYKKHFPYVVIIALCYVIMSIQNKCDECEAKRLKEMQDQRDQYKESYFKTNDILNLLQHEPSSNRSDTVYSINVKGRNDK
jgi:hypothetical protein